MPLDPDTPAQERGRSGHRRRAKSTECGKARLERRAGAPGLQQLWGVAGVEAGRLLEEVWEARGARRARESPLSLQASVGRWCGLASAPHRQTGAPALGRPQQLSWAEGWPGPQKPSSPTWRYGEGPRVGDRPLVQRTRGPTRRPRGEPGQGGMPHRHGGPQGEGMACEAGASGPRTTSPRCTL